jgi:hypothetical protein
MNDFFSKEYNLGFSYPDHWTISEGNVSDNIQVFTLAPEEQDQHLTGRISILVQPQGQHLAGIDTPKMLSFIASEVVKSNFSNFLNYILIYLRENKINRIVSREMLSTYQETEKDNENSVYIMQMLQMVMVSANKLILITYTAPEKRYPELLNQIEDIIYSIKIRE